jgi:hypothetical protein
MPSSPFICGLSCGGGGGVAIIVMSSLCNLADVRGGGGDVPYRFIVPVSEGPALRTAALLIFSIFKLTAKNKKSIFEFIVLH